MKTGFPLGFEPFPHRDPVTGETRIHMRDKHSRQSSPRLKNFQKCVRQQMEGKTFRGGDARSNSMAVRSNFTAAAKACSGGGGGRAR